MSEFASRMSGTYRGQAVPRIDAVRQYGANMTMLTSGLLAGFADALRQQSESKKKKIGHRAPRPRAVRCRICRACRRSAGSSFATGSATSCGAIGVASLLERAGAMLHWGEVARSARLEPQQRLRLAFEELGPTFVKLGQMLSLREDLLPPKWTEELAQLRSSAAPVPFDEILPVIEHALGRPHTEVFADLEREPSGSASIAQVHRARLRDGRAVVLKVRRPGIEAKVEADLRLLSHLAQFIESEVARGAPLPADARGRGVPPLADARARSGRRGAQHRALCPQLPRRAPHPDPARLPAVDEQLMNVQEHIDGICGEDVAAIERAGLDPKLLARRGVDSVLKMILVDGFFHADPHPGNVIYLPGNRIAMIDFGMAGRLSPTRRNQIIDLLAGVARRDNEPMLEVLLDWAGEEAVDEERLAADVDELVVDFAELPLKDIRIGALIERITAIMREHGIVLPTDLTLLFKALITLEALGRKYDPEFVLDRPAQALSRACDRGALRARGGGAPRQRGPRPVPRPDRLGAARPCAAAEGCAPRPHAYGSRPEAARQLRAASSTARSTASPSAS